MYLGMGVDKDGRRDDNLGIGRERGGRGRGFDDSAQKRTRLEHLRKR